MIIIIFIMIVTIATTIIKENNLHLQCSTVDEHFIQALFCKATQRYYNFPHVLR